MAATIPKHKKREYLLFIRSNFEKHSQRKIANLLGVGKTTVNRWCRELSLIFKKHTVNENFFDEFNEFSSYILGLIFSDGSISWNPKKGYYSLTITASEKDKDHLEKIRRIMYSTKPLLYSAKTRSYRLIVNNKKLCRKLIKLGVIPRKSLIVEFPNIPKDQLKHFIRGVIDGDGTVRFVDRKRSPYFEISIASGSIRFCEGLVDSIKQNVGVNTNIRKLKNNIFIMQYSCTRGKKLADYIYSQANIFLERKYLPYKKNINGGR